MRGALILILTSTAIAAFADNTTTATTTSVTAAESPTTNKLTTSITVNIPCLVDSPCYVVKDSSVKIMDAINKSTSAEQTIALVKTIANSQFDFKLMTRYALGNNWKLATEKQQAQLVDLFRDLLVFTYSTALSKFKDAKITLTSSTINTINGANNVTKDTAVVVSQVLLPSTGSTTNNQPVKVEYDLVRKDNQPWKAYDIKIENASLVTTYRNQFNDVVQSSKIDGLIKQLQTKVSSLKIKTSA